ELARADLSPLSLHDALPIFLAPELVSKKTRSPRRRCATANEAVCLTSCSNRALSSELALSVDLRLSKRMCASDKDSLARSITTRDRKSTRLNSSHVKISYAG